MEANVFITQLKADGSVKDRCDLTKIYEEYTEILADLPSKDRGTFSLNVLCILCRNLEKVPCWRTKVDLTKLLHLAKQCICETRTLEKADRVKTLACIYHIHKHVVKENTKVPPQLLLEFSNMPFENDYNDLLHEYCKTYWNILVDRLKYIETLKSYKRSIHNLLPKLTEDIVKVIKMYDTVQYCSHVFTFLIKKLHFIFSDINALELNKTYQKVYETLSTKEDLKMFKKLPDKECLELYVKLNDCFYVVAENASKLYFKDSILYTVVRCNISIFGHCPDLLHCLQTCFLNTFCSLLSDQQNLLYTETVLNNFIASCESAEKLGYSRAMLATYPFLSQLLKLYIEYYITNSKKFSWKDYFNEQTQKSCLKIILFLLNTLRNCEQVSKCENCSVRTGLHDGLRLSFLTKHFINMSVQHKIQVNTLLPILFNIITAQHKTLKELCVKGCKNYEKCNKKLQADIHNTAITLNNIQERAFAIKLFDIYLQNEIQNFKTEIELKNISRALYNKSICELDEKLHLKALNNAYLSLIFAQPEGLSSEKYMSLVMDIKAKSLKYKNDDDDEDDELQMMTVLDACESSADCNVYGNLKPFFYNLTFSSLLKHEYTMYASLWPSVKPIAGVWRALYSLVGGKQLGFLKTKDPMIRETLFEIIMATPTAVRTMQCDHYKEIINELIIEFEHNAPTTAELNVIYATLLFLKTEFELSEASQKYDWKTTDSTIDPDVAEAPRTVQQEHDAIKHAVRAVHIWRELTAHLDTIPNSTNLENAFKIAQVFVFQLLQVYRMLEGLQLAHICCEIARYIQDDDAYVRNASVIICHAIGSNATVNQMIQDAAAACGRLAKCKHSLETVIMFTCECAIYHCRVGAVGLAAKLLRQAQARIIVTQKENPDVNLSLGAGRLLQAAAALRCGASGLHTAAAAHRHLLATPNTETKWTSRRLYTLTLKQHITSAGKSCTSTTGALLLWRRAKSAAGVTLRTAGAVAQGQLFAAVTNTYVTDDAKKKIDYRIKHIIGVPPCSHQILSDNLKTSEMFTPKQDFEMMLENCTKRPTSPLKLPIPGFSTPEFLKHQKKCNCHACTNPMCAILVLQAMGLEASMYYRAKEFAIARNYYEGCLKSIPLVEQKLKRLKSCPFEKYIVEIVEKDIEVEMKKVLIEILIENSYFELCERNFESVDANVVRIHEILQECDQIDGYTKNEVQNLVITIIKLREMNDKPKESNLEAEFEAMKLSPVKDNALLKTPEVKAEKPPKIIKNIVKDEEVPKTLPRVIQFNLDDENSEQTEIEKKTKKAQFKIPVPKSSKPVLESVTPRNTRSKPEILVTQASADNSSIFDFATPKPKDEQKTEFFTPMESVEEQFFTPMTSVKTYSKKSLRQTVVKNLENEFSTPKVENIENLDENNDNNNLDVPKSRSRGKVTNVIKDKRSLKRATSPGKLTSEPTTRI